jgi:prolyl-tRNA synthetase
MQKYSKLYIKTKKSAKEFESVNATLLQKAGFIYQEMAGVYSFLPLGMRVLTKIENIVRDEMNKIGAEVLMSALAPKEIWEATGRLDTIDVLMKTSGANDISKQKSTNEYVLNCTHEDVITPIAKEYNLSYKDFPFAFFQIQTKFRNEARAKSGLLRGREFRMKDLYSFHTSLEDLMRFYEESKQYYWNVYNRLGLGEHTVMALASGGDFTKNYSHEFQVRCEAGEDIIYLDKETGISYNKEVAPADAENLEESNEKYEVFKACEVGNIFPLETKFSKAIDYTYTDENGQQQLVYMGSYGIGPSRVMGVIVEKFHDDKGIIWPSTVAPYDVHLVTLGVNNNEASLDLIKQIEATGKEVLWDDREDVSAGAKFADADLIGIPVRIVLSDRSLQNGGVEVKLRNESESKIVALADIDQILKA